MNLRRHATTLVGLLVALVALTLLPLAGPAQAAGNDYPFRADTTQRADPWGFTKRQCVSFAAWRLAQRGTALANSTQGWGDASNWDNTARRLGVAIGTRPVVGAVAQWNAGERSDTWPTDGNRVNGWMRAGGYGHVGVVQGVHRDGTVVVEQYNMGTSTRSYTTIRTKAPRYLYVGVMPRR